MAEPAELSPRCCCGRARSHAIAVGPVREDDDIGIELASSLAVLCVAVEESPVCTTFGIIL